MATFKAGSIEHIGPAYALRGGAAPTVPPVDSDFSPAEDFYMHVNAKWQSRVKMPSYEDDFGVSEEIELDLRHTLLKALEKHFETKPTDGLSRLAHSFLEPSVQATGVEDLKHELTMLNCIDSSDMFGKAVGHLNKIQARAPLSFVVNSDYYDSKKCCVYIYEAVLGLPSKSNYANHATNRILSSYRRFLSQVGELLHVDGFESALATEMQLISYLSDAAELRDVSYVYNPMGIKELEKEYSHISWRSALLGWGLSPHLLESSTFIVTNTRYIKQLDKICCGEDFSTLIKWMQSMVIIHFIKYLPPPFDDLHYMFYEKRLKGVDKKLPQSNLTLRVLMTFASQDLSRMFVRLAVPPTVKSKTISYVRLLKEATSRRISGLKWMEPSTKRAALQKVEEMSFQVAYPEKWRSETGEVSIDSNRPFKNLLLLAEKDTEHMIDDLAHSTCKKRPSKWREGAFEVNAYYYPEANMMVVPAGILRPPFFDSSRSDAWNLGGIGVAISHEITHGFDHDGRSFDAKGNYHDWWTASDERTYNTMSHAMVKLFDGQKYMGGTVDGKRTLNENLADLGGLAIALEALNLMLPKDEKARKAAYKDFFISFAVSWRQKDRPKKARQALLLDAHAPPIFRVNLIVRQFEEFYTAFDIKPTEKGYIPLEERIVFW
jgi:predicted metalloendopeptidase